MNCNTAGKSNETVVLQGHQPNLFTGQGGAILSLLVANRGRSIPSYRLARIALQHSTRVKECRDAGYIIESRTTRHGKQVHGAFRLVACPGEVVELPLIESRHSSQSETNHDAAVVEGSR
jgi:hypothetical protein